MDEKFSIWHGATGSERTWTILHEPDDQLDDETHDGTEDILCARVRKHLIEHFSDALAFFETASETSRLKELQILVQQKLLEIKAEQKDAWKKMCADESKLNIAFGLVEWLHNMDDVFEEVANLHLMEDRAEALLALIGHREFVRGATKAFEEIGSHAINRKPDAFLRDRPQEHAMAMLQHRLLVDFEFTNENVSSGAPTGSIYVKQGACKKSRAFTDDMTNLMEKMPQRSRLIGLFFHRYGSTYRLRLSVLDHEVRRQAIVKDCFGAGLSELIVINGVLKRCDPARLGILPAFRLHKEVKGLPEWRLSLNAEVKVGNIEKGSPITFVLGAEKSRQPRIFSRAHVIFACFLHSKQTSSKVSPTSATKNTIDVDEMPGRRKKRQKLSKDATAQEASDTCAKCKLFSFTDVKHAHSSAVVLHLSPGEALIAKAGWISNDRRARERDALRKMAEKVPTPPEYEGIDIWQGDNWQRHLPVLLASLIADRADWQTSLKDCEALNVYVKEENEKSEKRKAELKEEIKMLENKREEEEKSLQNRIDVLEQQILDLQAENRRLQSLPTVTARHWEAIVIRGYAAKYRPRSATWQEGTRYIARQMSQLVTVVEWLYEHKIMHRDISDSNVMELNGNVFLIDFDCSKILADGSSGSRFELTGQLDCMAIDFLNALIDGNDTVCHLARHELESILYLFFLRFIERVQMDDTALAQVFGARKAGQIQSNAARNDHGSVEESKAALSFTALARALRRSEDFALVRGLFQNLGKLQERGLCGRTAFKHEIEAQVDDNCLALEEAEKLLAEQDSDETFKSLAKEMRLALETYADTIQL